LELVHADCKSNAVYVVIADTVPPIHLALDGANWYCVTVNHVYCQWFCARARAGFAKAKS
jgi:hypothetical protein